MVQAGSTRNTGWDMSNISSNFPWYQQSPILLLLDNHVSHLYIPAIDLCKENHITLLSLPPCTSHKLQPLDRVVSGPLKTYWQQMPRLDP
ncbi:tigger transposable element-derived protein 6-like protein [Elysia marginata]|uniref:Tigger transposable element-derived protein 6-like protein n=1 Tax=Elysia marginata TaxID=1093978 RepID=A0AAV4HKH9_9GAST|nr:tigger transposable element-derived protein 6-like protein [Elysia marginata]